jgi:hypothetical protein
MIFRPRAGLLVFLLALLVFGTGRLGAELFDDEPNLSSAAIWAVLMAATFGLLATFTKMFGK